MTDGGYTQTDPIGLAGGLNRQVYVNQNPINLIDPSGLTIYGGPAGGGVYQDFPPPSGCRKAKQFKSGDIYGWEPCEPPTVPPPRPEPGRECHGDGVPWNSPTPTPPLPKRDDPSPDTGAGGNPSGNSPDAEKEQYKRNLRSAQCSIAVIFTAAPGDFASQEVIDHVEERYLVSRLLISLFKKVLVIPTIIDQYDCYQIRNE